MKRVFGRREGWREPTREVEQTGAGEAGEAGGVGEEAFPASPAGVPLRPLPDPEVEPKAQRRRFPAGYKLRILEQAESCTSPGELGALLRREGLYYTHLSRWRRLYRQGGAEAFSRRRGRKPDPDTAVREQLRRVERENQRLQRALAQAEAIIEVQKKLSEVLGISLAAPGEDEETSA